MDVFAAAEKLMAMDDATWRRHANPWSVWTRMRTVLPLLMLAIWSRVWIGAWALLPVRLGVGWTWPNPRAIPEPARFGSWSSHGVLGERMFLEHRGELVAHHLRAAKVLRLLSVPGAVIMIWVLWWEGAVFGALLAALQKIWFVDRMVWILHGWRAAGRSVPGGNDDAF